MKRKKKNWVNRQDINKYITKMFSFLKVGEEWDLEEKENLNLKPSILGYNQVLLIFHK